MINRGLTKRLTLPTVDLDLVRSYCAVSPDEEQDALIEQYIKSGFDAAEAYCARFFTQTTAVIDDFDNVIRLKSIVETVDKVMIDGVESTNYLLIDNVITLPSFAPIRVFYTTKEDMPEAVLMFILKFVLFNLEKNNPNKGQLDYSDLIPFIEYD